MKIVIRGFTVLCLINVSLVYTQLITQTPCADFHTAPMENFNKTAYIGTWFMHQLYDWPQSAQFECYTSIRTPTPDGNQNITEILVNPGLNLTVRNAGVSRFDQPGKGHWVYASSTGGNGTGQYDIIDTDYINYAIEWTCSQVFNGYRCFLFVMSRTPIVLPFIQDKIDAIIEEHHFENATLRTLDVTSCPFAQIQGGGGLIGGLLGVVGGVVGGVLNVVDGLFRGLLG